MDSPARDDSSDALPEASGPPSSPTVHDARNGQGVHHQASKEVRDTLPDEDIVAIAAAEPSADEDAPLLTGMLEEGRRRGSIEPWHRPPESPAAKSLDFDDESLSPLQRGGSLLSAIANMSNAILGAGAIGLPFAMSQAGLVAGIVLLVALGAITDWTIRLLPLTAKMSSASSYNDIMERCGGIAGKAACTLFQFAFAFGGCVAFCLIVGDTIPHVLQSLLPASFVESGFFGLLFSRPVVIILCTISYPLSLYRDLEKLSKASALALVSMCTILVAVATQGPRLPAEFKGATSPLTFVKPGIVSAIGVISFAYVCHHNSLLIYGSLNQPTLDRFNRVTHVSMLFAVCASSAMALAGYLVFTDKTQGNVLNNFPADMLVINVARGCFGLNMFTTLPLEAFVCRESIESFFFAGQAFDARRHVIVTTGIVGSAMLISLVLTDLGVVLELTGGIAATFLAFVMPSAAYLRLSRPDAQHRRLAWAVASFGAVIAVLVPAKLLLRLAVGPAVDVLR